jgi:hypothetical protein
VAARRNGRGLGIMLLYLRRPHAATSNEPWAVLAFADSPSLPSSRCHIQNPPERSVYAKPSRVARVGSGRACAGRISLCSGEQLKTCAGVGVQTSWRTVVPCCARVPPCCAVSQLARCFAKRQAVACARADAAYIRARRASGCWQRHFWKPHALGCAVHGPLQSALTLTLTLALTRASQEFPSPQH